MVAKRRKVNKHKAYIDSQRHRYDAILESQDGGCALCGRKPSPRRKLDFDHAHDRMVIRGLLDHRCNRALPSWITREWLLKAADYIEGETLV